MESLAKVHMRNLRLDSNQELSFRILLFIREKQIRILRLNLNQELSSRVLLFILNYDTSNQIVTQVTLNKIRRKISNDSRNMKRKNKNYTCDYTYYDMLSFLIETRFFQSNKHHLIPPLLLIYWNWRKAKTRDMKKERGIRLVTFLYAGSEFRRLK